VHRIETGANHVVQLVVPFALFLPQPIAGVAALAIIATQAWLMVSGNFAWLNAVTIVLATSALPTSWLGWLPVGDIAASAAPLWFVVPVVAYGVVVLGLSIRVVANLASPSQRMNAAFDPLHLVNTYGAFGSITRVRYEIVIEGTDDPDPGPTSDWREYAFRGKPGDPSRRPPQVAPFHLRLDWLLWFAAMQPAPTPRHRWVATLLARLLDGDPRIRRLLRDDPFGRAAPAYVRARRFRYRYTTRTERRATGDWWVRDRPSDFVRPVSRDDLRRSTSIW
jgi:hypothetical protein